MVARGPRQIRFPRYNCAMTPARPRLRPPFSMALRDGLRYRCPHCHQGKVFVRWPNKVLPNCAVCGLSYFRESGYYVGGMIFTYVLTAGVLVMVYLLLLPFPDLKWLSENGRILLWAIAAFVLSIVLSRPAYALWLAVDYWLEPWSAEPN
jgi:uncharacterized protein (DUF983 family)